MHVLFVASQMMVEDERRRQLKRPNFPGKLSGEVQGYVDIVGYLVSAPSEEGARVRRLYISPGQTFQAKNRLGFQEDFIESPTIGKLFGLTAGGRA